MHTTRLLPLILLATLARADVLPPAQDSSSLRGKLTAVTGRAATLPVSATRKGFVLFNLESLPVGVQPGDIASARLRVFFPSAKRPGDLAVHTVTAAWDEKTTALEPGVSAAMIAQFPAATVVGKKFVEVDVTATVQAWRAAPATNFGFAILASGVTSVALGAKEGSGSGYPCELEVDIDRGFTITDGSIGGTQLADGAVSALKLAVGAAVANLADNSVALSKLASSSLTLTAGTGLTGGGSVSLGENVTLSLGTDLTLGGTTSGTFSGDGSALTNLPAPANVWKLGGNSGTTAGTHFLGTTDNVPVEFKVNGARALRLEYVEDGPFDAGVNVIGGFSGNIVTGNVRVGATIGGGGRQFGINQVTSGHGTVSGGHSNTADQSATVSGGQQNTASGFVSMIPGGEQNTASGRASFAAGTRARANHDGAFVWADVDLNNDFTSTAANQFRVRASGGAEIVGNLNVTGTLTGNGSGLTGVPVNLADGSISNAKLASSALTVTAGAGLSGGGSVALGGGVTLSLGTNLTLGGTTTGTFSGNGAALTDLDAASITTGNLANNRLGPNIPRLNSATTVFTGSLTATAFSGDGSALTNLPAPANVWSLAGNTGTTPGTDFLGTTDVQPLELKVNSQRGLRLEYANKPSPFGNDESVNVIGGWSGNSVGAGLIGATIAGGGRLSINTFPIPMNTPSPNQVLGDYGTVGGGFNNTAGAIAATVAGGAGNSAGGAQAFIGGGLSNTANGISSTILGGQGNVASGNLSFAGGFAASATHQSAFVWAGDGSGGASSSADNQFTVKASGGTRFFSNSASTLGVSLAPNGTSWGVLSDQNAKKNFAPVDVAAVLDRLAGLPVQRWNYKSEPDDAVPHLGPMAQAFKAAFYPGRDDTIITTLEFDGVALAAIQGLNQKLQAKDAEIAELRERLERLEALIAK